MAGIVLAGCFARTRPTKKVPSIDLVSRPDRVVTDGLQTEHDGWRV